MPAVIYKFRRFSLPNQHDLHHLERVDTITHALCTWPMVYSRHGIRRAIIDL